LVEAHEGASEQGEGEVDVVSALMAHCKTSHSGHPGVRAFDDPPMAAQALAVIHATARDAGLDAAFAAFASATPVIVGLVGV